VDLTTSQGDDMAQEWSLTPQPAPVKPRGKGAIITGIVLLVAGLLAFVGGFIGVGLSAADLVKDFGSPQTTPTTISRQLTAGTTYAIYEASVSGTGTQSDPLFGNVLTEDITVTGPGGINVPVQDPGTTVQTYDSNGERFGAVATFDPPTTGTYTVEVKTLGSTVVLAPSFTAFARAAVWGILILLGVLLGIVGLILLIVGLVRRSKSRKQAGGYVPSYPTPGQPQAYAQPYGTQPSYGGNPYGASTEPSLTPEPVAQPFIEQPGTEQPVFATPAPAPAAPQPVAPQPVAAPVQALPPAGWYADPQRPGGQRYWDGATWTQHTA
jgi:hypothetical protein